MRSEELAAWLRLVLTPGLGNARARKLLASFGLPEQLFAQGRQALQQVLPSPLCDALLREPEDLARRLQELQAWLAGADAQVQRWVVTLADPDYPPALLQTEDPPLMLFLMGQRPQAWPRSISIVGSRNPTPQGESNARAFGKAFAQAGLTVVSGMALGVDTAAHEGALDGALPGSLATIAVVGTGLDRVYPKRNLELAHRIASSGVILSEYLLGTPPLDENFPRRNRIISALGSGTLVVEAALQSGSLITARFASEQGKEVFAIPGSIHSPQSRGCHALIRQGAKLVETARDVLEELRFDAPVLAPAPHAASNVGADTEGASADDGLLAAMGYDPVGLDALIARTGIPAPLLQARLLELELSGEVGRLPGGLFQRTGSA